MVGSSAFLTHHACTLYLNVNDLYKNAENVSSLKLLKNVFLNFNFSQTCLVLNILNTTFCRSQYSFRFAPKRFTKPCSEMCSKSSPSIFLITLLNFLSIKLFFLRRDVRRFEITCKPEMFFIFEAGVQN